VTPVYAEDHDRFAPYDGSSSNYFTYLGMEVEINYMLGAPVGIQHDRLFIHTDI